MASSFFPRGMECPPLVLTTRISLWKWCRYKGGRSHEKISHNAKAVENKLFRAEKEENEQAKNRGDTIRTCDLYVPNVAL